MSGRRICGALGAACAAGALAGCGSGGAHAPDVSKVPLVPGSTISLRHQVCDTGRDPYCAWELVVVDPRYHDPAQLFAAEHRLLVARHWTGADASGDGEHAADSPDGKLRLFYATPYEDSIGIEDNGVRRSKVLLSALSQAEYAQTPALSMMLELGAA